MTAVVRAAFASLAVAAALTGFGLLSCARDRAEMAAQACLDRISPDLETIREAGA